ncbi:MAG: DUF3131 domain-containing protein, partial [Crenarchaeota archaeon]|nr:DUF3131 domain-containing protein [Thermoproteota archaeon]
MVRVKYLIASVAIIVLLLAVLLFAQQVALPRGNHQLNTTSDRTYWRELAKNAWEYFQPGKGVDATTGLHGACVDWPYFTDWDLGVYIQAIIDAEKLGILSRDGDWSADARLEKLLTFLERRELTADRLPYWWHEARTGRRSGEGSPDVIDAGKLLVALQNLRLHRPDLASRINYVVYNRTNYEPMCQVIDGMAGETSIYAYYVACGFAGFWPERFAPVAESILNNMVSAPKVETHGVELPVSSILCEPLFYSVFELKPDARLQQLAKQVYLAHEARYNATGKYVAFSEGNTALDDPSYAYEWVVLPDGRTWVVLGQAGVPVQIKPIIYFKVAVGFLAMYNMEFARNMVGYLQSNLPQPTNGYMDGVDENERLITMFTDKTNGLIISAARYAMENADLGIFPWQNIDLGVFPWPFIQDGVANNTALVIGESKSRGPVGAAQTIDTIGGILITERLARESSSGTLKAAVDSWMVNYDPSSGNVTLLDKTTNLIIVGNPGINVLGYYYNNLRDTFGPLVPVLFLVNSAESYNYLYVPSSGSIYKAEFDEQGKRVADYGVIMAFKDQFGRYVAMVYGLGANGTLGACQV